MCNNLDFYTRYMLILFANAEAASMPDGDAMFFDAINMPFCAVALIACNPIVRI